MIGICFRRASRPRAIHGRLGVDYKARVASTRCILCELSYRCTSARTLLLRTQNYEQGLPRVPHDLLEGAQGENRLNY